MVKNYIPTRKEINSTVLPLIIAHRGASALAPENTPAAFERAIDDGAEGIEFDVRLTRDGVPVVIHDATLERTGRRKGRVSEFTAAELAGLDTGSWFNERYPDRADAVYSSQRISTLANVLEYLAGFPGLIYIELKCKDGEVIELTKAVCKAITASPLLPQIIVKSFKLGVIPAIKSRCPDVATAALFAPKIMTILRKDKHLIKIAEEFGADQLSMHYSLITRKLMKRIEKKEMPVTIWTADNTRWIKRGMKLGLRAIITNDPARLLARRHEILKRTSILL